MKEGQNYFILVYLKIASLLLIIGFLPSAQAQTIYKVTYGISEIKLQGSMDNLDDRGKKLTEQVIERSKEVNYTLILSNEKSFFQYEERLTNEDESPMEHMLFMMAKKFASFNKSVYVDLKDQTLVFTRDMVNQEFMVKRNFVDFNWIIKDEGKKILGLEAKKAIGTYHHLVTNEALEVEAWFIPSIPLQSGPDIFNGLPGLIVEVAIKGAVVSVKSIEKNADLQIKEVDDSTAMSQLEYEELVKNLTKKYIDD